MLGTGAVYIETSNFSSSYDITPQVTIKNYFEEILYLEYVL